MSEKSSMWNHTPSLNPTKPSSPESQSGTSAAPPIIMTRIQMPQLTHEDWRLLVNASEMMEGVHEHHIIYNYGCGKAKQRDYHKRQLKLYRELTRMVTQAFLAT